MRKKTLKARAKRTTTTTAPDQPQRRAPGPTFPLVTRPHLALALGWHAITISKLEASESLPVEVKGAPGKSTVYSLPRVIAWRVEREVRRRRPEGEGPDGTGVLVLDLDQERAHQANRHARKLDLEIQLREGKLAPVAEMAAVVTELLGATKAGVLALPAALAESLTAAARDGGPRAVERALREAITGALRELAAWRPSCAGVIA